MRKKGVSKRELRTHDTILVCSLTSSSAQNAGQFHVKAWPGPSVCFGRGKKYRTRSPISGLEIVNFHDGSQIRPYSSDGWSGPS